MIYSRDTLNGDLFLIQSISVNDWPTSLKLSIDNQFVYITASQGHSIVVFKKDNLTGLLSYVQTIKDGINGVIGIYNINLIDVSHDNKYLYAFAVSSLAVFSRNINTGELTYIESFFNNSNGVKGLYGCYSSSIPPDDKNIYLASNYDTSLVTFNRNISTGRLTFLERNKINSFDGGCRSTTSMVSDNNNVFVTVYLESAIQSFVRNPITGTLTFHTSYLAERNTIDGLKEANNSAISPDDKNIYVTTEGDGISIFSRGDTIGKLTYRRAIKEIIDTINGLTGACSIIVSPDNRYVYVASKWDNCITVFNRDTSNGDLSYNQTIYNNRNGVSGLDGASSISFSPDGAFVYVGSKYDTGVSTFAYNEQNGSLVFIDFTRPGIGSSGGVFLVKNSSNGNYLFAITNDGPIQMYKRNKITGHLTYLNKYGNMKLGGEDLHYMKSIDLSRDNKNLYAVFAEPNYIVNFSIDHSNNALTFLEGFNTDISFNKAIKNPNIVCVSNDNRFVYITSSDSNTVNVFQRSLKDGKLHFLRTFRERDDNFDGLDGITSILNSFDNKNIYFTSGVESGIASARINACLGRGDFDCLGDTIVLDPGSRYQKYIWSTNETSSTIKTTSNGLYYVKVTDSFGVVESDTINLLFNKLPQVSLGRDTNICANVNINLDAGNNFIKYNWSNNATSNIIPITKGGIYYVVVTDSNGCKNSDTVSIIIYPLPIVSLGNDTGVCGNINCLLSTGNNYTKYLWSTSETSQSISVSVQGNYSVTVTDNNNCTNSDKIKVTFNKNPTVFLGSDTTIHINQSLSLGHFDGAVKNYIWSTGESTIYVGINKSSFTGDSLIIWEKVTDYNSCEASDTIVVHLNKTLSVSSTFYLSKLKVFPNPFSNTLIIDCDIDICKLKIFDFLDRCIYSSIVNRNKINLPTEFLNKGIYILEIEFPNSIIHKEIMKIE